MKYVPVFQYRFGSLAETRTFTDWFVEAYEFEPPYAGIGLHTPAGVHYRHAGTVAAQRSAAVAAVRAAHPEHCSTTEHLKIRQLPADVWISRATTAAPTAA